MNFYKKFDLSGKQESKTDLISESLFVYLFPGIGIQMMNNPCDQHPFSSENVLTAMTCWIVFAIAHGCSKFYKRKFSPVVLVVITTVLVFGAIFCAVICVHFSSIYFFVVVPIFNVLYFTPLFCLLYLLRELYNLSNFISQSTSYKGQETINNFKHLLQHHHLLFAVYLLAPFTALIQALLFLFGQNPDSIITQFTNSCGFFLSVQQNCSCGGDHYLCSIAANGNKLLVKPVRMGWRKNEKIIVNRQLLIANAFENWLEDHWPGLHQKIRSAYDACNIPVNEWSKHKQFANVLYVLMKPLEWLFLAWLYIVDRYPENRIARQYLPKNDLNSFINKKQQNENNH